MFRKFSLPLLACLFALCPNVLCLGAVEPGTLHFISKDAIDISQLLPDPPTHDSDEERCEMKTVLEAQDRRTPDDIKRLELEDKLTVFAFSDVIGDWFTADHCPKTVTLFAEIEADSKFFSKQGKEHWDRPRPPLVTKKLKPIGKLEKEGSYPSGHSTRGILFAEVLIQLFPEHREGLLERGRQIGWDRILAGVHYPSDVAAGRVLGQRIAKTMLANSDLQHRLEEVRSELSHAQQAMPAMSAR